MSQDLIDNDVVVYLQLLGPQEAYFMTELLDYVIEHDLFELVEHGYLKHTNEQFSYLFIFENLIVENDEPTSIIRTG